MFHRLSIAILIVLISASCGWAQRQPNPNSPEIQAVEAFQRLLEQSDDAIDDQAKKILSADNFENLKQAVVKARKSVKNREPDDIRLSRTNCRFVYEIQGRSFVIDFGFSGKPIRVNKITFPKTESEEAFAGKITWETLEESLDQAAADGFEGAVLVSRDGEIVLQKAYGFANRERKIKNANDTVFAIGSAPIDFTHAGILLLKDRGKLGLDDRITKFFKNVPADKQKITIRHLLEGTSGLRNFHHISSDKNHDHSWIDREEAVRRILGRRLLFEPGKGHQHSHSAWGLLAAVIEIVSGESYQDFSREHLYKPAGMKDTGFFGDEYPEQRIAVGYGRKSSNPNSPPHWGKTSWLVMGSGGQVSTLEDMYRWQVAMRDGKILSPESTRRYVGNGNKIHLNGDMFGFEFAFSSSPDQLFMLISNSVNHDRGNSHPQFEQLWRQIDALVRPSGAAAKYSLGIEMRVSGEGIAIQRVVPGSAAEKGGLKADDVLISVNRKRIGEDPMEVLSPLLQNGDPIEFRVLRNQRRLTIRVKPELRK